MVDVQERRLDTVFRALGDLTRRRMLRRLSKGDCSVGQLAEPFEMSLAAASKHVKALESAGLIRREIQGRIHVCRLNAGPMLEADKWLRSYERFWTARLDRLEQLLRHETGAAPATTDRPLPRRTTRAAVVQSPTKRKRSTR